MKTLSIALIAATLVAGAAPAFADGADAPSYKDQMTNLWVATQDPTYARLAGIAPTQLTEQSRMPVEHQDLD
jgi:hypothetical protein